MPPTLNNPNILILLVDQLRWPAWLTAGQMEILENVFLPNIFGRIRNQSYVFENFWTAATICTAARGTLLTGLYAPQTACYTSNQNTSTGSALDPAFWTWGNAIPALNPAYTNNVWWFGKWHVSDCYGSSPLLPYGFQTRTYPGGAAGNPSPDGSPNEGMNGGLFNNKFFANDAHIASDFIGWLEGQAPSPSVPAAPWCATVSLINPHDIADAPAWLQASPPPGCQPQPVYFEPPTPPAHVPKLYADRPNPWNFEDLAATPHKPALQLAEQREANKRDGSVTNWTDFLNWYYWLQYYVDEQIGLILNALNASAFASDTVILFLTDHGEFGGSHGLHDKTGAAYDEILHIPLYVQFPGQTAGVTMPQMCSSVDFFGLVCDLATGGSGQWRATFPDQAPRQSLWNFINTGCPETRVMPAPIGTPYVFHTNDAGLQSVPNDHIATLRASGAKLVTYSEWANGTMFPTGTPEFEFYNYATNATEMGNDYYSTDPGIQSAIAQYAQAMGSWHPASGLIATELNAPLVGNGTNGKPLQQAQAASQAQYHHTQGTAIAAASMVAVTVDADPVIA